tara:strand:+ start:198381 stop:199676 length:1296 start_codon:yes stop_codon:yes gene_type:complete
MKKIVAKIPTSPYALALYLLLLSIVLAMGSYSGENLSEELPKWLYEGLWNKAGMVFLLQMMFMLLLGLTLAKSKPVNHFISKLTANTKSAQKAYLITALISLLACWINWGLGLILGAIAAKKTAEALQKQGVGFNLGFLSALGYSGMMFWHNGLSGSAPLKAAEKGAIAKMSGDSNSLISEIASSKTLFSSENIVISLVLVSAVLLFSQIRKPKAVTSELAQDTLPSNSLNSTDKLGFVLGIIIILATLFANTYTFKLQFLNPNFINAILLSVNLMLYKSLNAFAQQVSDSMKSLSDLLLQFPLYFAIMGLLSNSGFIENLSQNLLAYFPNEALPFVTFISAGVVNFFVPSGGGQWLIQGPLIVESFVNAGIPLEKGIMALAFGDELTNMLQPFWALPLLAITGVKIKELLPYTFQLFLIGLIVYGIGVWF